MCYRKRIDPEAKYVAEQCGISELVDVVGNVLHEDDLEQLRTTLFRVSKDTIKQLFEKTEINDE